MKCPSRKNKNDPSSKDVILRTILEPHALIVRRRLPMRSNDVVALGLYTNLIVSNKDKNSNKANITRVMSR